jgi:hypothetical protein
MRTGGRRCWQSGGLWSMAMPRRRSAWHGELAMSLRRIWEEAKGDGGGVQGVFIGGLGVGKGLGFRPWSDGRGRCRAGEGEVVQRKGMMGGSRRQWDRGGEGHTPSARAMLGQAGVQDWAEWFPRGPFPIFCFLFLFFFLFSLFISILLQTCFKPFQNNF